MNVLPCEDAVVAESCSSTACQRWRFGGRRWQTELLRVEITRKDLCFSYFIFHTNQVVTQKTGRFAKRFLDFSKIYLAH